MDRVRDQAFQDHISAHSRPVTPVPGESQLSTSVSINYSLLMTKAESIIKTPRFPNWESNFGQLTNASSVPNISFNNCSQCVQNFHSPTDLHNSAPDPLHRLKFPKATNLTHINIMIILSRMLFQIIPSVILRILKPGSFMTKL